MSETTHLLLLRHGQSTWNSEGRWQGSADPPLSPLGLEQARTASRSLGAFDAMFSSDPPEKATMVLASKA